MVYVNQTRIDRVLVDGRPLPTVKGNSSSDTVRSPSHPWLAKRWARIEHTPSPRTMLRALLGGMFSLALLASGSVQAQSSACVAGETLQTFTFASPNNWTTGSGGPLSFSIGSGASAITVTGTAGLADIQSGYPTTQQSGGIANTFWIQVDRVNVTDTNLVTLAFNKPVNKLRFTVTDLDTYDTGAGKYQDLVTVTGGAPGGGGVTPSATATSALVTISGNVAFATNTVGDGNNCDLTSAQCNATFNFGAPVLNAAVLYGNASTAYGNPPAQGIGIGNLGFCIPNVDLSMVKDDGGASFTAGSTGTYTFTVTNNGGVATTAVTTMKDILPAGMSFVAPLAAG